MNPSFEKVMCYIVYCGEHFPLSDLLLEHWDLDFENGKYVLCRKESPDFLESEWTIHIDPSGDMVPIWEEQEDINQPDIKFYYSRLYEIATNRFPSIKVIRR